MTKQTIIMRKDLNMRKGKMIAQGSHAVLANIFKFQETFNENYKKDYKEWLSDSFRKITLYVNSEEELIDIYNKAIERGLLATLIIDNGDTEFNGVKTKTCVAIGPHQSEEIDKITSHLKLL